MQRREFIEKSVKTGLAIAVGASAGQAAMAAEKEGKKPMKILLLTGSPRKNGNSNELARRFTHGAQEAGHQIIRFDTAMRDVHLCIACNSCGMDGPCVFDDDFTIVRREIIPADMVVFCTPMYYFGISSQLKHVIDRFYAINGQIHVPKKAALLMTYANTNPNQARPITNHYDVLLDYLGWQDAGRVIAPGVWTEGSIKGTRYPEDAWKLGKNL